MKDEVDCVILWHYYNAEGKLINASSTHLMGSMDNLNDRIREAYEKAHENQKRNQGYSVAAQIIVKGT